MPRVEIGSGTMGGRDSGVCLSASVKIISKEHDKMITPRYIRRKNAATQVARRHKLVRAQKLLHKHTEQERKDKERNAQLLHNPDHTVLTRKTEAEVFGAKCMTSNSVEVPSLTQADVLRPLRRPSTGRIHVRVTEVNAETIRLILLSSSGNSLGPALDLGLTAVELI